MAKRKLSEIEYENWCKVHKRGCSNLSRCKINGISSDMSNGYPHNIMVVEIVKMLMLNNHKVLTECVDNKNEKRRYDIYCISFDEPLIIEVEDSGKIKEDAHITIYRSKTEWKVLFKNDDYKLLWENLLANYAKKNFSLLDIHMVTTT